MRRAVLFLLLTAGGLPAAPPSITVENRVPARYAVENKVPARAAAAPALTPYAEFWWAVRAGNKGTLFVGVPPAAEPGRMTARCEPGEHGTVAGVYDYYPDPAGGVRRNLRAAAPVFGPADCVCNTPGNGCGCPGAYGACHCGPAARGVPPAAPFTPGAIPAPGAGTRPPPGPAPGFRPAAAPSPGRTLTGAPSAAPLGFTNGCPPAG